MDGFWVRFYSKGFPPIEEQFYWTLEEATEVLALFRDDAELYHRIEITDYSGTTVYAVIAFD